MSFTLIPFDRRNSDLARTAAALWNAACGIDLAIPPHFVEYNLRPPRDVIQAGWLAHIDDQYVAFALVSAYHGDPVVTPPEMGWIDALVVAPNARHRGIGSALLKEAEMWLLAQGCTAARLGGGLRRFVPGLPAELGNESFFVKRGYEARAENTRVWDVARDLHDYVTPPILRPAAAEIRPARAHDADALREFFTREFPGRWRYEFEQYLREDGSLGDYTILETERGVDAFCQITFEHSQRPIEHFYMHALPRPWGQAGPLGVSADRRAHGYGAAIVDGALRRLVAAGVRGCVIDWTHLVNFYARFGFTPYREYLMLLKPLASPSSPI